MNAKLLIDGKEFDIEILDPKLQELLAPPKKRTGYEEDLGGIYYYDDGMGVVACESHECTVDDDCYKAANYYSDKSVAENNVRADKLMRQLRRFAVEHRDEEFDWFYDSWYEIYYDYSNRSIRVGATTLDQGFGTIKFDTYDNAELAMESFRDELLWYFTEYKDSL